MALNERLRNVVTPRTVWTIGRVEVHPNASSVVPGEVRFAVQWRDAEADRLVRIDALVRALAEEIATERELGLEVKQVSDLPPVPMDPTLRAALADAAGAEAPGRCGSCSPLKIQHLIPTVPAFVCAVTSP